MSSNTQHLRGGEKREEGRSVGVCVCVRACRYEAVLQYQAHQRLEIRRQKMDPLLAVN